MAALLGLPIAGCTGDSLNLTASFGGATAGGRGEVQVLFINNTSHRAVFTVGTYDQTDPDDEPDFSQFGHDDGGLILEGDAGSPIGSLDCARVFSIGGPRMLALVEENVSDEDLLTEALIEGVEFFSVDGDDEAAAPVSEGTAPAFEALLGVDFPCSALLIIRFEEDEPGSFRIDFELIPSESNR